MVTGDDSCDNSGISLGAWYASCLVTGHGEPVVLSQGHFSQEPLEQALSLSGVFRFWRELRRMRIGDGVRLGCLRGQGLCREQGAALWLNVSGHGILQVGGLCWSGR